ncbi:MAG TPA: hypothetical protein VKX25_21985 [Bryobacteraceae bacterium]|jgi:hypothetical protein|nr:hypothetical protein [Bryobacteraceae bacterium]
MQQVAAHQDRSEQLREQYTYTQKVRIRAIYSNGKLAREELCVYQAVPAKHSTEKELKHFEGRYAYKDKLIAYQKPGEENPNRKVDIDAGVLPGLRDGLIDDKDSRDGLGKDLFPLSSAEVKKYDYSLMDEQNRDGRAVYHIRFRPKKERQGWEDEETIWAGEALIDKQDEQALWVTTRMAKGIPLLVRTMLGTNLRQLGFTVSYKRVDSGIYFPATYGGEFDVRAVFFYKRTFTISLENTDFRRAHAESTISYQSPQ